MTEMEAKLLEALKRLLLDTGINGAFADKARAVIAEAESAQQQAPQPSDDGWIPWAGGECPIGDDVLHQVRFRDGGESGPADWASDWRWLHEGHISDVVAYRIVGAPK